MSRVRSVGMNPSRCARMCPTLSEVGGLTKESLTRNKNGRVVSKKASARAKKAYTSSPIKAWADAVKAARKALGVTGFVAIGGKSAAGRALYAKAKAILSA